MVRSRGALHQPPPIDEGDDDQRAGAEAKRLDVRLQVSDLVLEAAHRAP